MASPPTKIAKLDHPPSYPPGHRMPPPPPASSRRLGLTSGVDRTKVRSLQLAPRKPPSAAADALRPPVSSSSSSTVDPLATLARAARAILARPPQPTPESLQGLYALTEQVTQLGGDRPQQLYDRIRLELERAVGDLRRALAVPLDGLSNSAAAPASGGPPDEAATAAHLTWIERFDAEVKHFAQQVLLVRSVLLHLDRTYVLQSPSLLSIWDLGLDLFQHSVLADPTISSRITASTLALVDRERSGTAVPRPLLRSFLLRVQSFATFEVYDQLVTQPFLDATATHYAARGNEQSKTLASATYLDMVNRALSDEQDRVDALFGGEPELSTQTCERVEAGLIKGHVEEIATKDTADWCIQDQRDHLATLYRLLQRIGALPVLRAAFLSHVKPNDATMVDRLIQLRHAARALVEGPFQHDEDEFGKAVNSAFESAVNQRQNKPAEMMGKLYPPKYLDAKLRSGGARGLDDAALERTLDDVLYLFRFTQGKDIFEAFYKRDLAKRLLLNKSASFDAERSMLLKLKDECGPGFTQKLEIMFKDMDLSSDVMRAFSASTTHSGGDPFDLSVAVLSQGNWPTYPPFPIALPPALTAARERFRTFYVAKHGGRTLSWAHGLDTVTLRADFSNGRRGGGGGGGGGGGVKKELLVSLAQAVVLLLFNDTAPRGEGGEDEGTLTLEEIAAATQLEAKELSRTLQSLACGKVRVLTKQPKSREVNPGDRFAFNSDFKSDHVRIKINQIQQKETVEENKSTTDRVFTDRASHLQLAIVRIMKARKTLKHQELVMEVVSQIGQRFKVEPAEIKKSISSLIDREYMARAEDDAARYNYLA